MQRLRLLLAILLLMVVMGPMPGADDPDLRQQAKLAVEAGNTAMKAADSGDANQLIEAAICFAKALKTYEKLNDVEAVTEMNSNIFWCKKKMNDKVLIAYNQRKSGAAPTVKAGDPAPVRPAQSAEDRALIAKIDEVENRKVAVNEATTYFTRAEKFAKENPDKYLQLAIRWFEIAERFRDSSEGKKAQSLLLDVQRKLNDDLAKRANALDDRAKALQGEHDNYFDKKPVVKGSRSTPPSTEEQRSLATSLKSTTYKADYAKTRPEEKNAFARKLYSQALKTTDDAKARYVMLSESARLALEGENCWLVITAYNQLESDFEATNAAELKKLAFQRASQAVYKYALKLLENSKDPVASANLGRNFCIGGYWKDGLGLLAAGDHADLKKVATLERIGMDSPGQKVEVADLWYDLAKKTSAPPEKEAYLRHAHGLYHEAIKKVEGLSKERVAQRITELDKVFPPPVKDWKSLTVPQWEAIKAPVVEIEGKRGKVDSGTVLETGKKYRVIAHPSDRWKVTTDYRNFECDWKGNTSSSYYYYNDTDHPIAALVAWSDSDRKKIMGIDKAVEGKGRLMLGPCLNEVSNSAGYSYSYAGYAVGVIRVKIVPVND